MMILISIEIKVRTCSYWKTNKTDHRFLYKQIFFWVSQLSQLTRDHMWKYDKQKYLSNDGSVENNF